MVEFIKELNPEYQLDNYNVKKNLVVFYISSSNKELVCHYCGATFHRGHSFYDREI